MIRDLRIADFLERLAAPIPTPGGGSAAGLAGSLAASLVAMVAALTVGKKNYQDREPQMKEILQEAHRLRDRLTLLIDLDAQAFDRVMEAYKLPKERDEQKRLREAEVQAALKHATEVPYQVARNCYRVLELAEMVATQGNKNAVSDAGGGVYLAEAALHAALLNVEINLRSVTDEAFKSQYMKLHQELSERARARRAAILHIVAARLAA